MRAHYPARACSSRGGMAPASLDLFWLKDESLANLDNLPEPADLAEEIIENIESGLNNFRNVAAALASAPTRK